MIVYKIWLNYIIRIMTMKNLCLLHVNCCLMMFLLLICMCIANLNMIKSQFSTTVGFRYSNAFAETATQSAISCVDLCLTTGGCFVANYHPGSRTCELVGESQTWYANANWNAYTFVSGSCMLRLYLFNWSVM